MSHSGRVLIRTTTDGGVLVLCPLGHVITTQPAGEWAGSALEARVGAGWVVNCDGATRAPAGDLTSEDPI